MERKLLSDSVSPEVQDNKIQAGKSISLLEQANVFPNCFHSLKLLFIACGFLTSDSLMKLYVYLYRIGLLTTPLYVVAIFAKDSNPLFSNITGTDRIVIQFSMSLLTLHVLITEIFCIQYLKKNYVILLYNSLQIDLKSDTEMKEISDKFA
eukprot:286875_1